MTPAIPSGFSAGAVESSVRLSHDGRVVSEIGLAELDEDTSTMLARIINALSSIQDDIARLTRGAGF